VTALRWINLVAAVIVSVATLLVGEPDVFLFVLATGFVFVIVGAGSVAADAFPFRRLAFICSVLTIVVGFVAVLSGFVGLPPQIPAFAALALQVAPVAGKLRS